MSDSSTKYVDGYFAGEREITVRPNPKFPFSNYPTPDKYSRTYDRQFQVAPANYVPKITNRTAYTNLLTYSQDLTNAAWAKNSSAAALSTVLAPDGLASLDSLKELAATAEHNVTQAATVTAAPTMMGAFIKSGLGRRFVRLAFTDSAATVFYSYFDNTAGILGSASAGVTAAIFPLVNGDYWCIVKFTPAAGAGTFKASLSSDGVNANLSYAGDAAKGAYVWGCQLGALPTAGATGPAACGPYVSTTTAARSVLSPDVDPKDPMAYLVTEDDPVLQTSDTATVARMFARVPIQQIRGGSLSYSRPTLVNTYNALNSLLVIDYSQVYSPSFPSGGKFQLGVILDENTTKLYAPAVTAYRTTSPLGTAGTFTVAWGASVTAALAYNISDADLATAVGALASLIAAGITINPTNTQNSLATGGYIGIRTSVNTSIPFVVDFTGVTTNTGRHDSITYWLNAQPTVQQSRLLGIYSAPAHGMTGSHASVQIDAGGSPASLALLPSASLVVVDSDTLALAAPGTGATILVAPYRSLYTPGNNSTTLHQVTDFYLPGVTPGITTADDIPSPPDMTNAVTFLTALAASSGWAAYGFQAPATWNGPIYQLMQNQINLAAV
jgi:hypothetical protein